MKFAASIGVMVVLLWSPVTSQSASPGQSQDVGQGSATHQRFVCNTGYTLEKCHGDVAVLRKTLDKYPAAQLGEWTWVLVRSEDWKAITQPRGMNPDSPAFTYYEGKETFLEEALVTVVPRRSATLLITWGMRRDDLLEFAVTHELGHALCNEKSEVKTEYTARLLRGGKPASCETTLRAKRERQDEGNDFFNGHGSFD